MTLNKRKKSKDFKQRKAVKGLYTKERSQGTLNKRKRSKDFKQKKEVKGL